MIKEKIINKVKKGSKKAAIGMARYYANVACSMVVYQPKMKESIKKLRNF